MKTELGIDIETYACYVEGEHVAKLKEEIEDKMESLKTATDRLLDSMMQDKVTSMTCKAPGGSLFKFTAESAGVKVKISHAKEVEQPVLVE